MSATASGSTAGSTRCWKQRSMWSVERRRSDASTWARMEAGRLSRIFLGRPSTTSWPTMPNFVAITARPRREGVPKAEPSSSSLAVP